MDFGAVWERTKEALADAYLDIVGLAIGVLEAVAVAIAAIVVARLLRRRVERVLRRARVDPNVTTLAANAIAVATYVVAVTLVLALLGASWSALIAVVGAGTVAITLALQDVLKSFVAGVYLLLERPFTIGDRIQVKDVDGTVEGIDLRTTILRTATDERVLVPNATVFAEVVTNRSSASVGQTAITLKGLTTPLDEMPEAVAQALAGLDGLAGRAPTVKIVGVGADGTEVAVSVYHQPTVEVVPGLIARLRERFPEATIVVDGE